MEERAKHEGKRVLNTLEMISILKECNVMAANLKKQKEEREKTLDQVYEQRNLLAQALASTNLKKSFIRNQHSDWPVLVIMLDTNSEVSFHIPKHEWNPKLYMLLCEPDHGPVPEFDGSTWKAHSMFLNNLIDEMVELDKFSHRV